MLLIWLAILLRPIANCNSQQEAEYHLRDWQDYRYYEQPHPRGSSPWLLQRRLMIILDEITGH